EDRQSLISAATARPEPPSPEPPASPAATGTLPTPVTSLVGRTRERDEVRALFREGARLVTLTGPGGVGKTRLALHLALEMAPDFPDGVAFVPLDSVHDPDVVPATIAAGLGVRDVGGADLAERVRQALLGRQVLLVLDNLEHLSAALPRIAELLIANPGLRILATSRISLRLSGEHEYPVLPLPIRPVGNVRSVEELATNDAIALFVQRARAVSPGFALTAANAPAVVGICARLDGLPLAIELAAARIKVLPPDALLSRLEADSGLLAGGVRDQPARLQSLRATIAWSYDLLEPWERALFRQLAVFAGGFTLEAAETIAQGGGDGQDVLDGIGSLIDKSLVQRVDAGGEPRFGMLQTIREFGLEQLAEAGELAAIRAAHGAWCLDLADRGYRAFRKRAQAERWLDTLEAERSNLRDALAWFAETGDGAALVRITGLLYWFWYLRGSLTEGRAWLERALTTPAPGVAPLDRMRAMISLGQIAHFQGDDEEALAWAETCAEEATDDADPWSRSSAMTLLGIIAEDHGNYALAEMRFSKALAIRRQEGDTANEALMLQHLGVAAWGMGDTDRAYALCQDALRLQRPSGDRWGIANTLGFIGLIAGEQGRFSEAATALRESLDLRRRSGAQEDLSVSLTDLAVLASLVGDAERAARLFGAAEVMRLKAARFAVNLPEREVYERAEAATREALGEAVFARAYAAGSALDRDAALAEALSLADDVIGNRLHRPHDHDRSA
ncbi:MAG: tetratricopeptide repeat protein, partial [Chloroflexota bacterium]|nr:tetratricopeptide repeat protein [Chloroflexota bacterium]